MNQFFEKNQQISNWTTVEFDETKQKWICRCFCGKEKHLNVSYLRYVAIKHQSCGCLSLKKLKNRTKENNPNFKHGMHQTRVYRIWSGMISRCTNPKDFGYPAYGGRGIAVCERWKIFTNFLEDMKEPNPKMTLDRIDNDSSYNKENCRWASYALQARNKRCNLNLEYNGKIQTLMDWSIELNINYQTLYARLRKGKSVEEAFENRN